MYEEEKPINADKLETEPVKGKDMISYALKLKGHELINSIIMILLVIFLFDFFGNNKKFMGNIIEILKTLLFVLSGYIFGKNEKE